MLGATISLGSVATGLVANQFGLAASTSASGASIGAQSSGVQISYVIATVSSTAGCPDYRGVPAGAILSVTVFDYGSVGFHPVAMVVNGTTYFSTSYQTVGPGDMATYGAALAPRNSCAHSWGQTVMLVDANGDDFQFET